MAGLLEHTDMEAYQTDVESFDGTLFETNSSVTQFPSSSSVTEYGDVNEKEYRTQLQSESLTVDSDKSSDECEIQKWLDKVEDDDTKSTNPQSNFQDAFDPTPEKIEKMGIALADRIQNELPFSPDTWLIDNEQQVPNGNFASNFIDDVDRRLPLALMNMIKVLFTTSIEGFRHLYTEVLYSAAKIVLGEGESIESFPEISKKDFLQSSNFQKLVDYRNGEYFTELRLKFNRMPKHKQPIVRAVQNFVNESIDQALSEETPVLFTSYAQIPTIVQNCNYRKGLGYNPDQIARYGLRLQQIVFANMTERCLDVLAYCGVKLKKHDMDNDAAHLSSNDSVLNQSFSLSQNSPPDSGSITSTQGSENSDTENTASQPNSLEGLDNPALRALQNSPAFVEYARANHDSPGSSLNSYINPSSPSTQYSIPEQIPNEDDINLNADGWVVVNQLDDINSSITFEIDSSPTPTMNVRFRGHDSSEDEGPQRRRRRID